MTDCNVSVSQSAISTRKILNCMCSTQVLRVTVNACKLSSYNAAMILNTKLLKVVAAILRNKLVQ